MENLNGVHFQSHVKRLLRKQYLIECVLYETDAPYLGRGPSLSPEVVLLIFLIQNCRNLVRAKP